MKGVAEDGVDELRARDLSHADQMLCDRRLPFLILRVFSRIGGCNVAARGLLLLLLPKLRLLGRAGGDLGDVCP